MVVAAAKNGPSGPEIRLESTKGGARGGGAGEPRRQGTARRDRGRSNGPSHLAARGWQHKEPPGGGPVGESEWTRPEVGRAEGHGWRRRRMDWYYIAGRGAHGNQFIRASRTNCQPAESSGMSGKVANQQEQVPCPQCGKKVQRRNLKRTEGASMMGYSYEDTLALFVNLRYARRTPPFKTGRTICTPLTSSVWRTTTRWTGRNTLPASSWIGGSDSTTSKGMRPIGPISE